VTETLTAGAVRALALDEAPTKTGDGRTVLVRLVKYGVDARVTDDGGRSYYVEQFAPGSVRAEIGSLVYREIPRSDDPHFDRPKLVGKISGFRSTDDGAYAEVRISASTDGADLLADIDDELVRHVSMEFDAPTLPKRGSRAAGPVVHTDAVVHGLLFTNTPQSPGADVLGRRSTQEQTNMAETPVAGPFEGTISGTIDGNITTPDPVDMTEPAQPLPESERAAPASQHVAPAQRTVPTLTPTPGAHRAAGGAGSRFRSFGEFAQACAYGAQRVSIEEREMVYRALQQAALADVTGLIQTQWQSRIVDLVREYTPVVEAFDKVPLPEKGMTMAFPTVTQRPLAAKQSAEAAALSTRKVQITPTNVTVDVYGGGQEMGIATIQRTDPSYLDMVLRLYAIEMARAVDAAATAAVMTASIVTNAAIEMGNTDALINTAFTAACVPFLTNLGRLPEFALINIPMWQKLANAVDTTNRPLFPTVSPFNPAGSVSFTSPDGQTRDLPFRVAPAIGVATEVAIVGVAEAFVSAIGPMQNLQADIPETLVHQMAVFEFAAFGALNSAGLQKIINVV
jgi:hypothetical protein